MGNFDFLKIHGYEFNLRQAAYLKYLSVLGAFSVFSMAASLFAAWILSSYFNVNIPGSLMYKGDDGWCNARVEGLGVHCFGDFNERFNPESTPELQGYSNNLELTPVGPFLTFIANFLADLSNPRLILILFYIFSIVLILAPVALATSGSGWIVKISAISLFGIGSYPFLTLIDRLNYLVFSVPILYLLYSRLDIKDSKFSGYLIVLLTSIKPQFALLVLIFLFRGQTRKFIKIVAVQIFVISALVIIPARGSFGRITEYISRITGYGFRDVASWELQSQNPPNASLAKVYFIVLDFFVKLLNFKEPIKNSILNFTPVILSFITILGILVVLFKKCSALSDLEITLILTVVALLGFGKYVAVYYFIFVIPILAVFLREFSSLSSSKDSSLSFNLGFDVAFKEFVIAFFFSTTTLIIPNFLTGGFRIPNTNVLENISPALAVVAWFFYIIKILVSRKVK